MIRAGTCGALRDDLADGSLVVATGAVREDGLTPRLVPPSYPAIASPAAHRALAAAAERSGTPITDGVVLTEDRFYPSAAQPQNWAPWQACHVVAVEMEAAPLFVIAALHGAAAGGIFTVDGNPTRGPQDMTAYDPHRAVVAEGKARMLRIALDALIDTEPP